MTDLRKAAEMALEKLTALGYTNPQQDDIDQIKYTLRQALAQPEQELVLAGSLSVRYFRGDKAMTDTYFEYLGDLSEGDYTLYTAPPKREWVGLTAEDWKGVSYTSDNFIAGAEWAQSKLKEKNS